MINWGNISIRNKLVLMQVFTSVLVLSVFFTVFIITDIRSHERRKTNNLFALAHVAGINSISALRFQDTESAGNILAEMYSVTPEIVHAAITDQKGKLFAVYDRPGSGNFEVPEALHNKTSTITDDFLYVSSDIYGDTSVLGKVYLQAETTELKESKRSQLRAAIILIFAALGLSFIIAIGIQVYISKRILSLLKTMQEVGISGDYSKSIPVDGKDEISTLISEFNNMMLKVKESQQRKDEFIGIASHELKTPLTSIKGYLELLKNITEKQPDKLYVEKVFNNVTKLELLIRDLLDVSKIQSGQLDLYITEFNIQSLINETVAAIQLVNSNHEIIIEDRLTHESVSADRNKIEQVLTNILSNAIKYSPGEKKVIVRCKKTGTDILVQVRDFGIGISKEEHTNIFERFYRAKDMTPRISGFGLGLYISREIILRHNGRIWAEGEDQGTSFYFTLPESAN